MNTFIVFFLSPQERLDDIIANRKFENYIEERKMDFKQAILKLQLPLYYLI